MTFWDEFKDSIRDVAGAVGDVITSQAKLIATSLGAGMATQKAVGAGAKPSSAQKIERAVSQPFVQGQAEQGASGFLTAIDVPYRETTSKALSSAYGTVAGIPGNLRLGISPGQSNVAALARILPGKQKVENVDWTNKQEVDEFFSKGLTKYVSGTLDGFYRVIGDPVGWSLAGLKTGVVRVANRPIVGTPEKAARLIEKESLELDAAAVGLKSPAKPLVDRIMDGYASRAEMLSGESIIYKSNNPSDLATALWDARAYGREAVADVLKIGIGNEDALRKVSERYVTLNKIIEDAKGNSEFYRQRMLDPINQKQPYWATAEAESLILKNKTFIEEAAKENKYLETILRGREEFDIAQFNPNAPTSSIRSSIRTQTWAKYEALEQARGKINLARKDSYWAEENVVTSSGKAVRVLSWVDESALKKQLPSGHVALNQRGVADSYSEVLAAIRQARGLGGLSDQWASTKASEWMGLTNKYDRDVWLSQLERDGLFAIIRNKFDVSDLNDNQIKALRLLSDKLIDTHITLRRRANAQAVSNNFMVLDDSGDTVIVDGLKQFIRKYADDYDMTIAAAKRQLAETPGMESQIPDFRQIVDFRLYKRIMDANPKIFETVIEELRRMPDPTQRFMRKLANLEADITGQVQPRTLSRTTAEATDVLDYVVDNFNAVWKPTVLMRLGYPIRNVIEGAGRTLGLLVESVFNMGFDYTKDVAKGMAGYYARIPQYGAKYVDTTIKKHIGRRNLKISEGELRASLLTDDTQMAQLTSTFGLAESSIKAEMRVLNRINKTKIKDLRTALVRSGVELNKNTKNFIGKLEKYLESTTSGVFDSQQADELAQTLLDIDGLGNSIKVINFWKKNSLDEAKMIEEALDSAVNFKANAWARVKEAHPNMAENYQSQMALVKTSFLKRYREFDRAGKDATKEYSRQTIDNIRADLREGRGLNNPIWLEYTFDADNNLYVYVSEGNHRLVAAIEEGIDELPVVLARGYETNLGVTSKAKLVGPGTKLVPEPFGTRYYPSSANPIDVLPDKAFKMPKATDILRNADIEDLQLTPVEIQGMTNIMNLKIQQANILQELEVIGAARAAKLGKLEKLISKADVERVYNATGKVKIFDDVEIDDAFGGLIGAMARGDVSAMNTVQEIFVNSNRGALQSILKTKATRENIRPSDPNWGRAWVDFINREVANDKVMVMFAKGEFDEDVIKWLGTKEAEQYRKINQDAIEGVHGGNLRSFVEYSRLTFEKLVPLNNKLREKVAAGQVTLTDALRISEDLRATVPGVELRPGALSLSSVWNSAVNGFFRTFGSVPEDVMNRNPLYRGVYQAEVRRVFALAQKQGTDIREPGVQESLVRSARRTALKVVEENLYTVKRRSGPAEQARALTPFYMAQQNSARFWLGAAAKNPLVPYLGIVAINSLNKAFTSRDMDEYNKRATPYSIPFNTGESFWLTLPQGFAKMLGVPSMEYLKVSKDSMNVWLQGDFIPMVAQFGPLVQYPVSKIFEAMSGSKIDPDRELQRLGAFGDNIKNYIMPFGRPMTAGQVLQAPGWARSLFNYYFPEQSEQYWTAYDTLVKERQLELWNEGKVITTDMYAKILDESSAEARQLFKWEAIFRGGLPVSSRFGSNFELLRSEYFLYQERYGRVVGAAEFQKRYGAARYTLASASLSYNPGGILSTPQTARNYEQHKDLFNKVWLNSPEVAGQLINAGTVNDYSAVADEKIRGINVGGQSIKTKTRVIAKEAEEREISVGWGEYIPQIEELNAAMLSQGIRVGTNAAEPYKLRKDQIKAEIAAKYPAWGFVVDDLNQSKKEKRISAIYTALNDKKFMSSSQGKSDLWQGLLKYAVAREIAREEIIARDGQITTGSLDRVSNEDIKNRMAQVRMEIGSQYVTFSDFAERYLDNDNLAFGK